MKYRMGIRIWIRIQVRGLVTQWLSAGKTRMPLAGRDGKGIRGLRSRWHGCGNGCLGDGLGYGLGYGLGHGLGHGLGYGLG